MALLKDFWDLATKITDSGAKCIISATTEVQSSHRYQNGFKVGEDLRQKKPIRRQIIDYHLLSKHCAKRKWEKLSKMQFVSHA